MPPEANPTTPLGWLPYLFQRVLFPNSIEASSRIRPLSFALVVLLPALLLYPCLGFHLFEPDEGRYAQIPKEMVEGGDWVVPHLMGEPYLDKPPLMYWLVAGSFKLFGISAASARLIPAVCVHLTILAVYFIGRRSLGERAAFWAAMLLSVAPGFLGIARLLLLDGLLTFCVTTSLLCGFEAIRTGTFRRSWWIAAAIFSGLGFLTKGPISEVLLFPPLLAFAWLTKSTARIGWKNVLLFGSIVIGVNLPWYIAMALRQPEFLGHFFWEHNVMRFAKPFDHLQPVWYYGPIFAGGFLPGMILGVPYIRSLLKGEVESRTRSGGFWLLAGLWCLAFFSFSGSKLPTYILPAFPPLALALGEFLARSRWNASWFPRIVVGAFALLVGFAHYVAVPWYAKERSPMGRPEVIQKYLDDPEATIVVYPRNLDSVAFYTGRTDLQPVRTKDTNPMIVASHFRPKTVILFTHNSSLAGFKEVLRTAVGSSVKITSEESLKRKTNSKWVDQLLGGGPWGLCDIAVIEPPKAITAPVEPNTIQQAGWADPKE